MAYRVNVTSASPCGGYKATCRHARSMRAVLVSLTLLLLTVAPPLGSASHPVWTDARTDRCLAADGGPWLGSCLVRADARLAAADACAPAAELFVCQLAVDAYAHAVLRSAATPVSGPTQTVMAQLCYGSAEVAWTCEQLCRGESALQSGSVTSGEPFQSPTCTAAMLMAVPIAQDLTMRLDVAADLGAAQGAASRALHAYTATDADGATRLHLQSSVERSSVDVDLSTTECGPGPTGRALPVCDIGFLGRIVAPAPHVRACTATACPLEVRGEGWARMALREVSIPTYDQDLTLSVCTTSGGFTSCRAVCAATNDPLPTTEPPGLQQDARCQGLWKTNVPVTQSARCVTISLRVEGTIEGILVRTLLAQAPACRYTMETGEQLVFQ